MSADRIVVLKNGKIVEEGKHKDLISKKGEYYKLWKIQKGGYM
jgi:ATP-binding cassette subfamily B protein